MSDTDKNPRTEGEQEPNESFPLLSLPPELWSRILHLAVTHPDPLIVNAHSLIHGFHNAPSQILINPSDIETDNPEPEIDGDELWRLHERVLQPPLTRVSRLVRAECLPAFYGNNTFVGYTNGTQYSIVKAWLERLLEDGYAKYVRRFYYLVGPEGSRLLFRGAEAGPARELQWDAEEVREVRETKVGAEMKEQGAKDYRLCLTEWKPEEREVKRFTAGGGDWR